MITSLNFIFSFKRAFYSVILCVMINFSVHHNVLCFSFVVVLYSMYSFYVSVNSKPDHPPGRPPGIRTFSLPGCRVFAQLSLYGVRDFELDIFLQF